MKLWLSKNSEVSVSDQLVEQITLGIASQDLKTGEKLPSTSEIARRFQIHQNTVIAAYGRLAAHGLVEFKKGSGVYVSRVENDDGKSHGLEPIIDRFLLEAAASGYTLPEVSQRLQQRLHAKKPTRVLLVESDIELQKILLAEIESATGCSVEGISFEDFSAVPEHDDLQITAMFDEKEKLGNILPPGRNCIFLRANSVPALLTGRERPSDSDLIAVVSGWERFLTLAKLFLLAANIEADTIITRSPDSPDWLDGLQIASLIICDSLTAKQFPSDSRIRVFPLIAEASLAELLSTIATCSPNLNP